MSNVKMCPYFNCTMNCVRNHIIHCKGRHNDKTVKFLSEENKDKHFNNFCGKEFKSCNHYKILKAKEISRFKG